MSRRKRLCEEVGLTSKDAETIVEHRPTADLFDEALSAGAPADVLAKQFVNVWLRLANDRNAAVTGLNVDAARMAALANMAKNGTVNKTAANRLAEVMLERTESPERLADELGLIQVQDTAATQAWVDEAFANSEQAVRDARTSPKKAKKAAGFLRGQVMRISKGQADPILVGRLIEQKLAKTGKA